MSGSSTVNCGAWTRGHHADIDNESQEVEDPRWSYNGLLPYFKSSERWHNHNDDAAQHGFSWPIHISTRRRDFPFREYVKEALLFTGLSFNPDMNSGDHNGFTQRLENWHHISRQHPTTCYELRGVHVMANTVLGRVFVQYSQDKGVELSDGQILKSSKEVVLSCGILPTPLLSMLSDIGPKYELLKFDIKQVIELPDRQICRIMARKMVFESGYSQGWLCPRFNRLQQARICQWCPYSLVCNRCHT